MFSLLYILFIAPLEVLMNAVLSTAFSVVGSYGWAVVILSLVVNTALLPIYAVAEGWQIDERRLRERMKPKEKEIKEVFRGQERRAMLRTLHRQNGYTPLLPLRSSVGFLLQVPFFFAAYHLLSHALYLNGVAFGPLSDLGVPDGLLTVGGWTINSLPLLMTAVNLVSAFVYTKNLGGRDKVQLFGLTLIFLIVLYEAPAALTLYWTLNNVFSLVKNIFYDRIDAFFRKKGRSGRSLVEKGKTSPAERFLRFPVWGELALIALGGVLTALFATRGITPYRSILVTAMIAIFALSGVMCLVRAWADRASRRHWRILLGLLGLWALMLAWVLANDFYYFDRKELSRIFVLYLLLRCLPLAGRRLGGRESIGKLVARIRPHQKGLLASAVFTIGICVFLYAPTSVFISDPASFSGSFEAALTGLSVGVWCFLGVSFLLSAGLTPDTRALWTLALSFVAVLIVLYTLVFSGYYGVLKGTFLGEEQALYSGVNYLYDAAIIVCLAAVFCLLLYRNRFVYLSPVLAIVCTVLFLSFAVDSASLLAGETKTVASLEEDSALPSYNDNLLSFSKEGKNVVILVLDMFTGDHIVPMLERVPGLEEKLSGFTWYRDTLSVGSMTRFGLAAIHGGPSYSVFGVQEQPERTLLQAFGESYCLLTDFFGEKGYSVGWGGTNFIPEGNGFDHCLTRPDVAIAHPRIGEDYLSYWRQWRGTDASIKERDWPFLIMSGLFRASPYSLRKEVYNRGNWRLGEIGGQNLYRTATRMFSFFDTLSVASNANNERDVFRYFYTEASHTGGLFSPNDGLPTSDLRTLTAFQADATFDVIKPHHFFSEQATLLAVVRWLDWLRAEGIYDNTRIVITADHGFTDSPTLRDAIGGLPASFKGREDTSNPGSAYPLLLVKDFGMSGALRISDRPMSNADVPELVSAGIGPLPERFRGNFETSLPQERERFYAVGNDSVPLEGNTVDFVGFKVKGTMFKPENWQRLGESK